MKNLTLPLFVALVFSGMPALQAPAQPLLTYANHAPQPGESYVSYLATATTTPTYASVSATGANYTWNFSGVVPINGGTITSHYAPNMTQFGNLFPMATVACQVPLWGTNLFYVQADTNKLIELGQNNLIWDNARTLITYPFTYNDVYTDTASYYSPPNYNWIWQVSGMADGYGSVILPYGTVNNVLHVSETVNRYTGQGWIPEHYFFWYQPGTHTPICFFYSEVIDYYFFYRQPASPSDIQNAPDPGAMKAYPNPFTDVFMVDLPSERSMSFDLSLQDCHGREVYRQLSLKCQEGDNRFDIRPGNLDAGAYVLVLQSPGKLHRAPLVVVK